MSCQPRYTWKHSIGWAYYDAIADAVVGSITRTCEGYSADANTTYLGVYGSLTAAMQAVEAEVKRRPL